jgi:dTMP kinase
MKKARYICLEGTEGVGKTTQTQKLVDYLRDKGYSVLQTKEPGTHHSPLTMVLRGIMLDSKYEDQITPEARELVSQAIRSIHLKRVILPNLYSYDFIVQDRGIISGYAYGEACGNKPTELMGLSNYITETCIDEYTGHSMDLYDDIIYLKGDVERGLDKAKTTKQEFAAGDAMEARGLEFMYRVQANMDMWSESFNTHRIDVRERNIEEVFDAMLSALNLKETNG